MENKADELTEIMSGLEILSARIYKVEQELFGQPRHTHSTLACIEDALAAAGDILNSEQVERERTRAATAQLMSELRGVVARLSYILEGGSAQREDTVDRIKTIVTILQAGRQGPNVYDIDRPAGRRRDPFRDLRDER